MAIQQLQLNIDAVDPLRLSSSPPTEAPVPPEQPIQWRGSRRHALERAVLRWLEASQQPTGVATDVPTRIRRYRANLAVFWATLKRRGKGTGPTRLLRPGRTMIVECHTDREECWIDCTRTSEILPVLNQRRELRREIEASIRVAEPDLRSPESLFEEYAEWRYEKSRNPLYPNVVKEIAALESALHEGTRFEQIRSAAVADLLFVAVPAGLLQAAELANGWGLLWVHPDLSVTVEREAQLHDVDDDNRLHLVINIAAAARQPTLALHGVHRSGEGDVHFTRLPRLHRRPVQVTLEPS